MQLSYRDSLYDPVDLVPLIMAANLALSRRLKSSVKYSAFEKSIYPSRMSLDLENYRILMKIYI